MSGERVQRWPAIARRYSNNITIFAQATQCLHHNGYPDLKVVPNSNRALGRCGENGSST